MNPRLTYFSDAYRCSLFDANMLGGQKYIFFNNLMHKLRDDLFDNSWAFLFTFLIESFAGRS